MKEPKWILTEVVIAIQKRQISEHGGLDGIRSFDLLESSLNSPKHFFHYENPKPSIAQLASSYAYSLIKNHPFNDGNKRIALITCELFLKLNGKRLNATQLEKYHYYINLASGKLSKEEFAKWIEQNIVVDAGEKAPV